LIDALTKRETIDPAGISTCTSAFLRLILFGLCVAFLAGCTDPVSPPVVETQARRTVSIGLIPEQNIFRQLERYEPFVAYFAERLDVKIDLTILPTYGSSIEDFERFKLDGAFFGSFAYVLAHERLGVVPIARPLALDNSSTYFGMILARADSGITAITEMRGKRFAFVDRTTTAGYLLPLDVFFDHGIDDYRDYFSEVYFAGTHEDALYDVLTGRADICAVKNTIFQRLAKQDPRLLDELVVLYRSADVPENVLALRATIDSSLLDDIKGTLLAMHANPEGQAVLRQFGARKFIETEQRDYQPVYELVERIGIDLGSYHLERN
jgi:phosphonate transport system substrate-binding protein